MDGIRSSDIYGIDGALVLHLDEKVVGGSPNDILTRRLKNRERQRRYRARKRHEADKKKSLVVAHSTPLQYEQMPAEFHSVPMQVEISRNVSSPDCLTRVYCQRDWKKDARSAHIHKMQPVKSISLNNSETISPAETLPPSWQSGVRADILSVHLDNTPVKDDDGTRTLTSNRRHWKAEARNKKSSE